ncbi:hypothetical protein K5V21_09760 [Clostridium sardiniense]|uniref:Uncharacterized protein n=1 Tax=Clostridium sardiniense TaxID=29369 RepID=A0ABS7KY50_CLOSR|nr:hypothetical protein [Clostridium sardiniense]MBY0755746.1 hypothetical protein [Clostridium sardiniense]MDQ0460027.1 hypothetical protein [Clostridium sardiniense]
MELKSLFIYFIVFSINLLALPSEENININNYQYIESIVKSETIFSENGVKIQYNIKSDINDEIKRIKDIYNEGYSIENLTDKNHFYIKGDNDLEIKVWEEEDRVFVEGAIINSKKEASTVELKKELQKLEDNKANSLIYFEYYKGKLNSVKSIKDISLSNELIKVHNGYVGKSKLKDGNQISYGIMEYDTGVYVIVGTPIIFTTY